MTRFLAPLLLMIACLSHAHAEVDFNALDAPPDTQSSAPAQPSAWTPASLASPSSAPSVSSAGEKPAEAASLGGAIFNPFSAPSTASAGSNARSVAGAPARSADTSDSGFPPWLALMVLAGAGLLGWFLHKA